MTEIPLPAGLDRRLEDYGLITGQTRFVDDLRPDEGRPAALYMAVVRSPYAHAVVRAINFAAARALPGVVAAFAGADLVGDMATLASFPLPGLKKPERKPLAVRRVRYVGDPVAVVLAENIYAAIDARDLVDVDYEPLQAVVDPEAALAPDAPLLYEEFGSNMAFVAPAGGGDIKAAFARADRTVSLRIVNQRLAPSSLEPRACMFDFDAQSGQLWAWLSSQALFRSRDVLTEFLGIERENIHVRNAQVGGAFGAKSTFVGEEIIAARLAVQLARPVKWIEDRSENLQAQTQGRGQVNYVEAAFQNDGRVLGLRVRSIGDLGAFLIGSTAMVPTSTAHMLSGPYQIEAVDSVVIGAFTNKVPTAAYRGAGRPEAAYILERTMDRIARELGMEPVEVRRRNFLSPFTAFHTVVTGMKYDSGNYTLALAKALELSDYASWRKTQQEWRNQQRSHLLGIGLSTFIEVTGGGGPARPGVPQEAATVRIRRDGTVLVQSGVASNGQGHFTLFTQLAAAVFKLPISRIEVQMNNADLPAFGIGTFGSRTTQVAASAIQLAAEAVYDKAIQVAARLLEAAPADLTVEDGRVSVQGVPARSVDLATLARMVEEQPDLIEHEAPNPSNGVPIEGLAAWRDFSPPGSAFSSGTHIAIVDIDADTGNVHVLRYVASDDCGRIVNNYLAEAQVHGALAQGIGQALYEEVVYDQNGQLLSGTLMDYVLPNAQQLPDFIVTNVETPSPTNPLGVKGAGEAGTIAAPPAIVNAVLDALAPLGIKTIDMPLTPEKIWALIQAARQGTLSQPDPAPPAIFSTIQGQRDESGPEFA